MESSTVCSGFSSEIAGDNAGLSAQNIEALIRFVNTSLPALQHSDGVFCFDRTLSDPDLRGRSVRYTILVLLGLLRQAANGGSSTVDPTVLHRGIRNEIEHLGVGDLSLLLWAECRLGAAEAADTLVRLRAVSKDETSLCSLEGLEAAWFVIGAAEGAAKGLRSRDVFDTAYAQLLRRRSSTSALFRHTADGSWRAKLPNFATEIYTLLALSETARHELAVDARPLASALAETLIGLRLPDGGWPWLYHADRAVVVEPYEVYSVHQDAMAPMALFALTEVTGDNSFARAAVESFQWCFGRNELGVTFYDPINRFAHRSIKRRGAAHSLNLWANTGLGGALGVRARTGLGGVEVNATCRPYHLGWILEAWCGREHLHSLVVAS